MKKLANQEEGVAHIVLIFVFIAVFVALGAFAYTRVSDSQDSGQTDSSQEETIDGENEDLDAEGEEDGELDLDAVDQEIEKELQQELQQ